MFEDLLKITQGDRLKAERYIQMYKTVMSSNLVRLELAIEEHDVNQLINILHDSKLMLSTVGLTNYLDEVSSIENELRTTQTNVSTTVRLKKLLSELQHVQNALTDS